MAGPAGDRGLHRARHVDQHHADLLARPLQGGRRGVPARARAARRRRRRPVEGRVGRVVLRLARRHRGRQAARGVGHPELQGKLAIANAKLAYQHYLEAFAGPRWEFLEGKGATKQRCLWASTSTKNPAYRDVMYVEELIGPETVNTMPLETIEAFQDHGEVRGDTVLEGVDEARDAARAARDGGRRLRRRRRDARGGGRAEVRRLVRPDHRGASGRSAARSRLHDGRRDRRADLGARPDALDGRRRGEVARLARRAVADARGRRPAAAVRRLGRRTRIDAVVLLGMGGSSLAPEVIKRDVPAARRSTSSTRRIRRRSATSRRRSTSRARSSSRRRSRARRSRRARTPTTSGSRRRRGEHWAAITDPGSALEELAREREFARDLRRRADDRRPLLGAVGVRDGAGGADGRRRRRGCSTARSRDGGRVPARRGQPGARARALARRGLARRPRQGLHRRRAPAASASGPSSCSPSRPASTARGSSRRPASRPTAPTGRRRRCGSPDEYELGQEFFRWEFATAVAGSILGINPFDQPDVQSAKDKTKEVLASGDGAGRVAAGLAGGALRAGAARRLRLHPGVRRTRPLRTRRRCSRSRRARARRRAASSRTASGRATCTRPGSCTRAARRPGSSCRSSTTPATSSRSRTSRSASAS